MRAGARGNTWKTAIAWIAKERPTARAAGGIIRLTVTKGEPCMFERPGDAGHPLQRVFCGDGGSPVFLINDANPGVRVIYVASAQPWDLLNQNIPEYDGIIPS